MSMLRAGSIALGLAFALPAQSPKPQRAAKPPIHGITISTHLSGQEWGTDAMRPCIRDVKKLGTNWIQIHPYARIHGSGRVTWRSFPKDQPLAELVRPIREAKAEGLKIFVKPHLAYWGSPFKWRGEIEFDTEAKWQRFFKTYTKWIVAIAAACREADGFAVGTELDRTLQHRESWQKIIRAVRKETKAPLTYAANWTDYQKVPFWNELDIIGIQAYFPITEKRQADRKELAAGWRRVLASLNKFSVSAGKNVVFTELGYTTSFDTAIRPWESKSDGRKAIGYQCLCTEVALAAIAKEPRVEGAFLWKWFPGRRPVGRDFPLATPEMKKTITAAWRTTPR